MSLSGVLTRKGAAVTFSKSTPGSYDATTDTTTAPVVVTVVGKAMEIDGDPDLFKALELIETDNPTLMFKPDTVGQLPALGATCAWGGTTFTVKNIKREAMNGTAHSARIVIGR